ncbi:Ankyrin repeat domain-containing protein 13C [Boothiomyces sp. JEL0866]|nr:Ankyrin repeat domain-containing protein 13C [Boothiomyces sp. JEL0866]KAJ3322455.1 Ankyrin repeat domain-containing protein 13C [Boothiomyces sp. JEL0866]
MTVDSHFLHRLVYGNHTKLLQKELSNSTLANPHPLLNDIFRGQTPLTLAISLGRKECIAILLDNGASTFTRNAGGWTAYQEAISYGDRDILKQLYLRYNQEQDIWTKEKIEKVLDSLLEIYKQGPEVRIDFSLVGYAQFKSIRQNISILVKAGDDRKVCFINHDLKTVYQLYPEVENAIKLSEEDLEKQISYALNSANRGANDIDWKSISITPVHSYFSKKQTAERIDGWPTTVWNLNSVDINYLVRKEHLHIRPFPQPLDTKSVKEFAIKQKQLRLKTDERVTVTDEEISEAKIALKYFFRMTLDPPEQPTMTIDEYFSKDEAIHLGRPLEISSEKPSISSVSGKLFLNESSLMLNGEKSPMPIRLLKSLLEVIGFGNEQMGKLSDIIDQAIPDGFPMRIELPILWLPLSACFQFQKFENEPILQKGWFKLPTTKDGYQITALPHAKFVLASCVITVDQQQVCESQGLKVMETVTGDYVCRNKTKQEIHDEYCQSLGLVGIQFYDVCFTPAQKAVYDACSLQSFNKPKCITEALNSDE